MTQMDTKNGKMILCIGGGTGREKLNEVGKCAHFPTEVVDFLFHDNEHVILKEQKG